LWDDGDAMTGQPSEPRKTKARPASTAEGRAMASRRNERLAEALRENLRRRKAQSRAQSGAKTGPKTAAGEPDGHNS